MVILIEHKTQSDSFSIERPCRNCHSAAKPRNLVFGKRQTRSLTALGTRNGRFPHCDTGSEEIGLRIGQLQKRYLK